jgi:hypothetical protein
MWILSSSWVWEKFPLGIWILTLQVTLDPKLSHILALQVTLDPKLSHTVVLGMTHEYQESSYSKEGKADNLTAIFEPNV